MAQAANLAKLAAMPTPLVGGENPELAPTDFSGALPRQTVAATPNPLAAAAATPGRGGAGAAGLAGPTPLRAIAGVAATPLALAGATPGRGGALPGATPLVRDALGLNEPDAAAAAGIGGGRGGRAAARAAAGELRAALAGLPAPQNEYAVAPPELPQQVGVVLWRRQGLGGDGGGTKAAARAALEAGFWRRAGAAEGPPAPSYRGMKKLGSRPKRAS
jgi:pre-mRNA-splicing factor CDC5/CEF1